MNDAAATMARADAAVIGRWRRAKPGTYLKITFGCRALLEPFLGDAEVQPLTLATGSRLAFRHGANDLAHSPLPSVAVARAAIRLASWSTLAKGAGYP